MYCDQCRKRIKENTEGNSKYCQGHDIFDLVSPKNHEQVKKLQAQSAKNRLEYLRGEIKAERISYGEIAELQSLAQYIDPSDVLLLEWAGVPEKIG